MTEKQNLAALGALSKIFDRMKLLFVWFRDKNCSLSFALNIKKKKMHEEYRSDKGMMDVGHFQWAVLMHKYFTPSCQVSLYA